MEPQLLGLDVVVHAKTGAGKTVIAAGPLTHPKAKGRVSILVSPLIALQNEQAQNFLEEYKLRAVAINSGNGGCTSSAWSQESSES